MIRRVMLDIETLGTRVGSVFFAIGAVEFTGGVIGREFSVLIDPKDAQRVGLTIDADTVGWWLRQSPEAQAQAAEAWESGHSLPVGLLLFSKWMEEVAPENFEVWGNAPSLDCALVEEGYRVMSLSVPWCFPVERCYRTLKALRPDIVRERSGTHHRALDDARDQARHAIRLLEALGRADWEIQHEEATV